MGQYSSCTLVQEENILSRGVNSAWKVQGNRIPFTQEGEKKHFMLPNYEVDPHGNLKETTTRS